MRRTERRLFWLSIMRRSNRLKISPMYAFKASTFTWMTTCSSRAYALSSLLAEASSFCDTPSTGSSCRCATMWSAPRLTIALSNRVSAGKLLLRTQTAGMSKKGKISQNLFPGSIVPGR